MVGLVSVALVGSRAYKPQPQDWQRLESHDILGIIQPPLRLGVVIKL
jgi:hypothetical protein